MDNKKNVLTAVVVVLILAGFGIAFYFYQQPKQSLDNIEIITPNYTPPAPLENKPDLNPADKANPFKGVKTNPFE